MDLKMEVYNKDNDDDKNKLLNMIPEEPEEKDFRNIFAYFLQLTYFKDTLQVIMSSLNNKIKKIEPFIIEEMKKIDINHIDYEPPNEEAIEVYGTSGSVILSDETNFYSSISKRRLDYTLKEYFNGEMFKNMPEEEKNNFQISLLNFIWENRGSTTKTCIKRVYDGKNKSKSKRKSENNENNNGIKIKSIE
jgi:hypothetical protein